MHFVLIFPIGGEQQTKHLLLTYQLSPSSTKSEAAVNLKYELVEFPVFVINVYFRNVKMYVHSVR